MARRIHAAPSTGSLVQLREVLLIRVCIEAVLRKDVTTVYLVRSSVSGYRLAVGLVWCALELLVLTLGGS